MKKFLGIFLLVFLFQLQSVYSQTMQSSMQDGPVQVIDILGRSVSLSGPASRIVSLSPSLTECIFAIDAGSFLVGRTEYCNYPAETAGIDPVGGFSASTVSIEKIIEKNPDLVVVSANIHEKLISQLEQLDIQVCAFEPESFDDVYESISILGFLCGKEEKAGRLVADMKQRIKTARQAIGDGPAPRVFWELWDDPLLTSGSATFVHEALLLAGAVNIFGDLDEQWPSVSFEQLLERAPDWILSGNDRGDKLGLEIVQQRPGWNYLPAVQQGNIAVIESDAIYRGGPRLTDSVETLIELFW